MYFTITGLNKVVRNTEGFVIKRVIISRFHCIYFFNFRWVWEIGEKRRKSTNF